MACRAPVRCESSTWRVRQYGLEIECESGVRRTGGSAPLEGDTPLRKIAGFCHCAQRRLSGRRSGSNDRKAQAVSGNHDPLKDWLVAVRRDVFGDSGDGRGNQVGADGQPTRIHRFTPISPIAVAAAGIAVYSPRLMPAAADNETAVEVLTTLHDYRVLLVAAAAVLVVVDVLRHRAHRWSQMLESVVRQGTGHLPKKVAVSFPSGWRVIRRATVTLHRGTIIRPKQFEELSRAIEAAFPATTQSATKVRHVAHRDRIVMTRESITRTPDPSVSGHSSPRSMPPRCSPTRRCRSRALTRPASKPDTGSGSRSR